MGKYKYRDLAFSLGEIRLATIQPGQFDDPLEVTIHHAVPPAPRSSPPDTRATLQEIQRNLPEGIEVVKTIQGRYLFVSTVDGPNSWDHPDPDVPRNVYELATSIQEPSDACDEIYEALSYTWGHSKKKQAVRVTDQHGESGEASLELEPNLVEALKYLRSAQTKRTMWVDAICINQDDIPERNREVPKMEHIYSSAQQVILWIGPEGDNSRHALDTLTLLGNQCEFWGDYEFGDSPGAQYPFLFNEFEPLPYDESLWLAISALFKRSWFHRVWVLQEALLNEKTFIQCGYDLYSWSPIRKACGIVQAKTQRLVPEYILSFLRHYVMGLGLFSHAGPELLLQWASGQRCEDARDKVYGILSLLEPALRRSLKVDYTISVDQCFKQIVLSLYENQQRLDLLANCGYEHGSHFWPSWVPNWTRIDQVWKPYKIPVMTSGYSRAFLQIISPTSIDVKGRLCGTVKTVSTLLGGSFSQDWTAFQEFLHRYCKNFAHASHKPTLESLIKVAARGRVSGRQPNTTTPLPSTDTLSCSMIDENGVVRKVIPQSVADAMDEIMPYTSLLFFTDDGLIGCSGRAVASGDRVCVLLGCDATILLRSAGDGRWFVMGPCYLDGLDDGEGLLGALETPWTARYPMASAPIPRFQNTITGQWQHEDPRLPKLADAWHRTDDDSASSRPVYTNTENGERLLCDPRMLPEALEARGVKLDNIVLV